VIDQIADPAAPQLSPSHDPTTVGSSAPTPDGSSSQAATASTKPQTGSSPTTTHHTTTTLPSTTETTETAAPPLTTGLVVCHVSISAFDVELKPAPLDSVHGLQLVPAGIYQVAATTGSPDVTWYQIDLDGVLGWVKAEKVLVGSQTCT
jgi:cytoskeletal protein RodZ